MKKESGEMLQKLFGPEILERQQQLEKDEPEIARLIEEIPIDQIWSRKDLPLREKSMITIASQLALGRMDQVRLHCESFLRLGGNSKELREIAIHLSIYCGFPATLRMIDIIREVESMAASE